MFRTIRRLMARPAAARRSTPDARPGVEALEGREMPSSLSTVSATSLARQKAAKMNVLSFRVLPPGNFTINYNVSVSH